MSDMKCPHCGVELVDQGRTIGNGGCLFACENINCDLYKQNLWLEIWQELIDGKKTQRQLQTVKARCVKKIKAKEREIESYLNGISVRQSENERLAKQLKQTQDALDVAIQYIKHTQQVSPFWFNRLANKTLNIITALEQKDIK